MKTSLDEIDVGMPIWARSILDHKARIFIDKINRVLEESVLRAKESLYAKRWWTRDLSELRKECTRRRNRTTTLRRRGEDTTQA